MAKKLPVIQGLPFISAGKLPRGIGLVTDEKTGELTLVGDPWGVDTLYDQIKREIVQNYQAIAIVAQLHAMGYSTTSLAEGEGGQLDRAGGDLWQREVTCDYWPEWGGCSQTGVASLARPALMLWPNSGNGWQIALAS